MSVQTKKESMSRQYLPVLACVCLAILCRRFHFPVPMLNSFLQILRPLLYIGLYSAWVFSFQKRIIHKPTRHCLTAIAGLMIFWMFARTCRYVAPNELVLPQRLFWYLYYIPLLLIPAISVCLALYMRRTEKYKIPMKVKGCLFGVTFLLVAVVLTNDLHQWVFCFPIEKPWTGNEYEYGFAYYIVAAWVTVCSLVALVQILLKCRIPKHRKVIWLPFVTFGFTLFYALLCYIRPPLWKIFFGDMTSAFCLLIAAIFESCILCGLIPSNSGHEQLFMASTIVAQVTDREFNVCYVSGETNQEEIANLSKERMAQAEIAPVMLEKGSRLSGAPIQGGHVLWQEDVSELLRMLKELEDTREELKDSNLMEEENLKAKKRIAQLAVKNHLYDVMQAQTAHQFRLLSELIHQYPAVFGEKEKKKILHKITVVGAYLKRRNNLIFITSQESVIPAKELVLCIEDTKRCLEMCEIPCNVEVKRLCGRISGKTAMRIYDFFEGVIEEALDGISALYCCIAAEQQAVILSMSVECLADLAAMDSVPGAEAAQDFDGSWLISFHVDEIPEAGGEMP